jgi:hypothetical protein
MMMLVNELQHRCITSAISSTDLKVAFVIIIIIIIADAVNHSTGNAQEY